MQDSPVGLRDTDYNSVFSSGQTVAASFDRGLFYARGYAMGSEHKGKGVTVQLGPVAGPLGRSPEGGRNWEGFSPDPCEFLKSQVERTVTNNYRLDRNRHCRDD